MSDDIEFDDVVDFESEEDGDEEDEEVVKTVAKLPAKTLKEKEAGLDNGNLGKDSSMKEIQAPTSNGFVEYSEARTTTIKPPSSPPPAEESLTRSPAKSITESLSMLTDDDEISRILNSKYSRRTQDNDSKEVERINGFEEDVKVEKGVVHEDKETKDGKVKLIETSELNGFEAATNKTQADAKLQPTEPQRATEDNQPPHDEVSTSPRFSDLQKLKSSSPGAVDRKEGKDSTAGRIEMTRSYLKALTPDEGLKTAAEKEEATEGRGEVSRNAVFEIGKRSEDSTDVSARDSMPEEPNDDEGMEGAMKDVDEMLEKDESMVFQRRQSMDDFIKKILAEAREDKQKDSGEDEDEMAAVASGIEVKQEAREGEEVGKDDVEETDDVLEKILSSKTDTKRDDTKFNGEIEDYEKLFSMDKGKVPEAKKDVQQNDTDDKFELKTTRNRHRIGLQERDEAEDEIEKILSSKKYEPSNSTKPKRQADLLEGGDGGDRQAEYMNGDVNDDFRDFLNKFKKERQKLFGQEKNTDRDSQVSAETQDYIRDRTQNIRAVIGQQSNICDNVKSVSKQLDDLEKELREVRQATIKRKTRLEAMENAVNAERKQYEIEHHSAVERNRNKKPIQRYTQEVKNQLTANILHKRQSRAGQFTDEMDDILSLLSSSKRRAGSVCSVASLMEDQDSHYTANSFNPSNDRHKYRSMSKEREGLGGWSFERKEGAMARDAFNRNSFAERTNFEHLFSGQSDKPRSRASVATMDMANSNADDFLTKIRSKYSFLNGKDSSKNHTDITHSLGLESLRGGVLEKMSYAGIRHMNTTAAPLSHFNQPSTQTSTDGLLGNYGAGQSRRALSVSDARGGIHFDKNIGGYTAFPSRNQFTSPSINHVTARSRDGGVLKQNHAGGGEFKSRFLDKVRERRASNIEHTPGASQLADRVMAKLHRDPPLSSASDAREAAVMN